MDCRTFDEIAAAAADQCLPADELAAVEAHLAECARCRAERDAQQAMRRLVRERLPRPAVPEALRKEVLRRLGAKRGGTAIRWRRVLLAGSIAAALLLGVAPFLRGGSISLLTVATADVAAAEAGRLSMAMRTSDAAALRGYYRRAGVAFDHSVEDFEARGLHLLGGEVSSIGTAVTTRTIYQGPQGKVVCRRFRFGTVELPRGGEQVGAARVFVHGGIQVVITQIGDVVCSMASRLAATPAAAAVHAFAHRD